MGLLVKSATFLALTAGSAFAAGGGGHGEEKGGMPQLDFSTFGSQIFWLVVSLVILFLILKHVAMPQIASGIEGRAKAVEDDLDMAAELRRKAEDAEAAYEAALVEARASAQAIAQATRDDIQKDVDAAIAEADAKIAARAAEGETRIAEIRDSAMAAVEDVAGETAEAVVEAVAPGVVDSADIRAAVSAAVKA
ncbi:MAG: F0F1 ATP synthase subunit B' [Pikeienuella sp.]